LNVSGSAGDSSVNGFVYGVFPTLTQLLE